MKNYILGYDNYRVLNEDAKTEFYETAACLGIYADGKFAALAKDILTATTDISEQIKEFIPMFNDILKLSGDWSSQGVSELNKRLKGKNVLPVILDIAGLSLGMYNFVNVVVRKELNIQGKLYFVHQGINKYYKLEKAVSGEIKGSKANTSDCIIMTEPIDKFFGALATKDEITIHDDKYNEIQGIKFVQCSLKKGEDDAQLGKITNKLSSLGLSTSAGKAAKDLLQREEAYSFGGIDMMLLEGKLFDKIKKVGKKVWDKATAFISKMMGPLFKKMKSIFKKNVTKSDIADIADIVGYSGKITESVVSDFQEFGIVLNEKASRKASNFSKPTMELLKAIYLGKDKILKEINRKILEITTTTIPGVVTLIGSDLINNYDWNNIQVKKVGNTIEFLDYDNFTPLFATVGNNATLKTLAALLKDSEKLSDNIQTLVAEMFFGGTKLSLWKVFGDYTASGNSWQHLGTIDTFKEEKRTDQVIEIFGFRISSIKNSHYTFRIAMLEGMHEGQKEYVILRTGTNSGLNFSYIIEGITKQKIAVDQALDVILNLK